MVLGNIIIVIPVVEVTILVAPVVNSVDTSLIYIIMEEVVHFVLQVNTAGTCRPLLLTLRLLLQLIC